MTRRMSFVFMLISFWLTGLSVAVTAPTQAQAQTQGQEGVSKIKVVTSFTILADMTRNIAGDRAEVVSVTKPGAEIHGYQPTPRDLVRASDADLLLWNGLGLERWFEKFLQHLGDTPAAVLTTGIDPISITSGGYAGKPNPHAWMGQTEALIYIDNIAAALSDIDPEGAAVYARNAEIYKSELAAVFAPLRNRLASLPPQGRVLVTCEGAFSYLARDLGMDELYIWPINADQIGTPQQVRKVIDTVRNRNVAAVFCESTVSTAPAEQIARETGARFGGVLYVDSLSTTDGPVPTFLDMMKVTITTIEAGLTAGGVS